MFPLDIRTILFSFVIIDFAGTLLMLYLWFLNRRRISGIFYWVVTFAFLTAAMAMIVTRGRIPAWVSFNLSNTLIITGVFISLLGLERFAGVKMNHLHNYILIVLFVFTETWFTFYQPDLAVRTLIESVAMLIITLQSSWLMLVRAGRKMYRLTAGTGLVFIALSLLNIARIVDFFVTHNRATDYLHSGDFEAIVLACFQILFILLTASLAVMFNKRLLLDVTSGEALVRESHSMLKAAMDCSTSGIVIADAPTGALRYVNKAGLTMISKSYYGPGKQGNKYGCNEILRIRHADGTPSKPEEMPLTDALINGKSTSGEFIIFNDDNNLRTVHANTAPILNESGKITAGIMVFHDITDSKNLEIKLKEKNAELEKFNKIMVGREHRMVELKQELNELCLMLGIKPRYNSPDEVNRVEKHL